MKRHGVEGPIQHDGDYRFSLENEDIHRPCVIRRRDRFSIETGYCGIDLVRGPFQRRKRDANLFPRIQVGGRFSYPPAVVLTD